MKVKVFKNEHKIAQEPVLVQKYLCTPVNVPPQLRVFFLYLMTVLLLLAQSKCRPFM